MLVKGLALTALVATTPLAFVVTQDPKDTDRSVAPVVAPAATGGEQEQSQGLQRAKATIKRTRAELKAAQRDLKRLRRQLDAALDQLDGHYEQRRERNCSPSRNRALMTHYQWLREQGHQNRADSALARVVDGIGENPSRLNSVAWSLMTDKDTLGKYDELALAIAKRMEKQRQHLAHQHLDTAALAYFLNGDVSRAVKLQRKAISKGGRSDDYRRRLRTYEAAFAAVAKASEVAAAPAATMVAAKDDE